MDQTLRTVVAPLDRSHDLECRVARLERSNRTLSLALVGALGLLVGAAMFGARQGGTIAQNDRNSGVQQGGDVTPSTQAVSCKPVSIVLDPSRGSGRWSSSLLAVDDDGNVFVLDTTRPQTFWRRFEFSP